MSENTNEHVVTVESATNEDKSAKETGATLVDAIFDIGLTWAAHGLKVAKGALEASGKTLDTTAKTLDRIADELAKKEDRAKAKDAA